MNSNQGKFYENHDRNISIKNLKFKSGNSQKLAKYVHIYKNLFLPNNSKAMLALSIKCFQLLKWNPLGIKILN